MENNSTKMGRKVMVSFLGTNNYLSCCYELEGKVQKPARFIQEVLADNLFQEWNPEDKIFIFYTEKSRVCNWVDNGQKYAQDEVEKKGLEGILKSKPYASCVEDFEILEGFSEEDVWRIFEIVYSKLKPGDQVYLDVTHAFRSIPLFSTVLFNYAQSMGVTLCRVCYGAFEKLGEYSKVKEMPVEERVAPIVDMSSIISLQTLSNIAHDFLTYGKVTGIGSVVTSSGNNATKAIGLLEKHLAEFSNAILMCKMNEIESGSIVQKISQSIHDVKESCSFVLPQEELLNKLQDSLTSFKVNGGFANDAAAVEWTLRFGDDKLIHAYVFAVESIITAMTAKYASQLSIIEGPDEKESQKKRRNFISGLMGIQTEDFLLGKLKNELQDYSELANEFWQNDQIQVLRSAYSQLSTCRNELCHGKLSSRKLNGYKTTLIKAFGNCKDCLL